MTNELRGFGARGNLDIESVRRQIDREFEPHRRSILSGRTSGLSEALARFVTPSAACVASERVVMAVDPSVGRGDAAIAVHFNSTAHPLKIEEIVELRKSTPEFAEASDAFASDIFATAQGPCIADAGENVQQLAERLGGEIIIANADPTLVVGNVVQIGGAMLNVVGRTGDSVVLRREPAPMISRTISQLERRVERAFNVPPARPPIRTSREQERRRKQLLKERKRIAADEYAAYHARGESCRCHISPPCNWCVEMPIHPDEVE